MVPKRILLVDDDHDMCFVISRLLRSRQYCVDVAHSGQEGLAECRHNPDLVLLDRTLPDMDGLDICRRIRDDKRLRNIPVIIITARDKSVDKVEGFYVGADDYITKPFDQDEFLARVEAVLRRNAFSERAQSDRAELITELKRILTEERITPFFQPIYTLDNLEPMGYELLSRPPQNSILSNPELLFKTALECGMYFDLEMMAWRKGFAQWKSYTGGAKLFLNCSPYLIEHARFDAGMLAAEGVDPGRIVLEITERMAIVDYASFLKKIKTLRDLKASITVDDVGCGFASLDTVAEVRPDFVKIDMPLVRDIQKDVLRQSIIEAVVSFCRKCSIATIAEGIEKDEELAAVRAAGATAGQGFFLARPAPEVRVGPAVCAGH